VELWPVLLIPRGIQVYSGIMDLVDAILEDRAPQASGEQARHVVDLIENLYQAVETGQAQAQETSF
jgi:predicted dehydrogenase